jgi:FMN reductase
MEQHTLRIMTIGGSNREGSHTLSVLQDVAALAEPSGASIDLLAIRDLGLPVYEPALPLDAQPRALRDLLPRVQAADAFLIASPTYHGTISGALKNLLDALHIFRNEPRGTFAGRPVGLIAYGGPSAINTINALHHSVRGMGGLIVPTILTVSSAQLNDARTHIADERVRQRAQTMMTELLDLAHLRQLATTVAGD